MLKLVWSLVLLLNVAAFAMFGFDKWRSRREGARRVPERTLLWTMLLGGFVGAWIAMSFFRHKTVKQPFRLYAMLWTLLNPVWLVVWWTWRELDG